MGGVFDGAMQAGQPHEFILRFAQKFRAAPTGLRSLLLLHSQGYVRCGGFHPGLFSTGPSGTKHDSGTHGSDLHKRFRDLSIRCHLLQFP
jgi:hypothetical protein